MKMIPVPLRMKEETPITILDTPEGPATLSQEIPSRRPATLQERFSAFVTDLILFACLLGGWAVALRYLLRQDLSAFSFEGSNLYLFLTTGAAIHFLYFLLFEGVLGATPGKLLTGLSIQKKKGGTPTLLSIVIRNFMRIVDYPLFLLTGIGLMETTDSHQRLGDLVSRTVVVMDSPHPGGTLDPATLRYGCATGRTIAFLLDLSLLASFGCGLLLRIPPDREPLSTILLNLFPLCLLLYLTFSEAIFQTTFGKSLLGLKVIREDGQPSRFSNLLVRNIFRLFDANPIGTLCILLATKKQRPGDLVAGTVVVKDRRNLRGWLAIPFMLLLAALSLWQGSVNPDNFFKKDYQIRIGTWKLDPQEVFLPLSNLKVLPIRRGEAGHIMIEHGRNQTGVRSGG